MSNHPQVLIAANLLPMYNGKLFTTPQILKLIQAGAPIYPIQPLMALKDYPFFNALPPQSKNILINSNACVRTLILKTKKKLNGGREISDISGELKVIVPPEFDGHPALIMLTADNFIFTPKSIINPKDTVELSPNAFCEFDKPTQNLLNLLNSQNVNVARLLSLFCAKSFNEHLYTFKIGPFNRPSKPVAIFGERTAD